MTSAKFMEIVMNTIQDKDSVLKNLYFEDDSVNDTFKEERIIKVMGIRVDTEMQRIRFLCSSKDGFGYCIIDTNVVQLMSASSGTLELIVATYIGSTTTIPTRGEWACTDKELRALCPEYADYMGEEESALY